jgi:hypothetical protein
MKTAKLVLPILILALVLSACSTEVAAATDEGAILDAVYTVAALTLSAQAAAATPTPKPAATATLLASATLIPTNAAVQVSSASVPVVNTGSTSCDNASFISDVTIPDGTIFAPGEAFTKTWSFQNSGSCTWTTSYSIAFVSGNAMSGSATTLTTSVSSGGQINASVEMVAPTTTGTYTGYWKLQNAAGTAFGQSVYVQIVVSSSAATITPTPTATVETSTPTATTAETVTSEPTSTTAATATTEPTATSSPTNTPEPTFTPESTATPETPVSS